MENILSREDVIELLRETVTDFKFQNKSYQKAPYGDKFVPNQYSLLLVVDALIKYQIIIGDLEYIDDYLLQIRRIIKKMYDHHDIVYGINSVLAKIVSVKLDINDVNSLESKKQILDYVYEKYIVNGYSFCGIPSPLASNVEKNGLNPREFSYVEDRWLEIKEIFSKYGMKEIITKDLTHPIPHVTLTDSPMMAYYYALKAPVYFSEFCSTNKYMRQEEGYDIGAYYRKDYNACKENIMTLCKKKSFSEKDLNRVIEIFEAEWNLWNKMSTKPKILFIKRSANRRDELKDFAQIKCVCENIDIAHSIGKIIESRFDDLKVFNVIDKKDIIVEEMLGFLDITRVDNPFEEVFKKETKKKVTTKKVPIGMISPMNAYGNVSILALVGALFLTLGATLTILLTIYGG